MTVDVVCGVPIRDCHIGEWVEARNVEVVDEVAVISIHDLGELIIVLRDGQDV